MNGRFLLPPVDGNFRYPAGLLRIVEQNLTDLAPWHVLTADLAEKRMRGLRLRYGIAYVPFARRQDNDDVACIDPARPGRVFIVHDFAESGQERVEYGSFWEWFRGAVEDMISFDP